MATVRTARLLERQPVGDGAFLRFEMSDGAPLGFRGGQYIIVDTGLDLPDGKRRKRAYSLTSSDSDQGRFELAVYPVAGGLGAATMLALEAGTQVRFSGPWGKLAPVLAESEERVWVVASDTGITAALGLLRGAGFAPALQHTTLVWWAASREYFLSPTEVEARCPGDLRLRHIRSPAVGTPERQTAFVGCLDALASEGPPTRVYLAGDGELPAFARAFLDQRGLADVPIQSENFFHHPVRKASLL
ncbi:MAG: FAD-dependent oxidoreductase [Myxococcales bacterium]